MPIGMIAHPKTDGGRKKKKTMPRTYPKSQRRKPQMKTFKKNCTNFFIFITIILKKYNTSMGSPKEGPKIEQPKKPNRMICSECFNFTTANGCNSDRFGPEGRCHLQFLTRDGVSIEDDTAIKLGGMECTETDEDGRQMFIPLPQTLH